MRKEDRNTLLKALSTTLLPDAQQHGMSRIWVAPARWDSNLTAPEGMSVEPCAWHGPRVAVRGHRAYGSSSVVEARWPEDGLEATRTPKIYYVLQGSISMRVADYKVHLSSGYGLLVPAGTPFSCVPTFEQDPSSQKGGALLMLLPYHDGLLCWIGRHVRDAKNRPRQIYETASIPLSGVPFYLNRLVGEACGRDLHHHLICDALWQLSLAVLHRELHRLPVMQTGDLSLLGEGTPGAQREHSIAQAQQYVHQHLRESLSIERVARAVCMSRTVFTAHFRAHAGCSFAQYVMDARFAQAEQILKDTDLAVHHVAALVGFKPARMRALFQQRQGVSPQQFRARSRAEYSENERPKQAPSGQKQR